MKEKITAWYQRVSATTEIKVITELIFWGVVVALWTVVGDMMTAYTDLIVYAGYLVAVVLLTISAIRIYNYFLTIKTQIKK